MSDSLVTKQDVRELELRMDTRLDYLEKHLDTRLAEQSARFDAKLADLERRVTFRLGGITVAGIGVVSVLVKLL